MAVIIQGYQLMALEWTMVAFTLFLVILRLYARLNHKGTIWSWYDFFSALAWFCFLVETCMDMALYKLGFFSPSINALEDDISQDLKSVPALKLLYVEDAWYPVCMYCVKSAMLCFYSELIPRTMKKTRIALWVVVGFTAVGFLVTVLLSLLLCEPISVNWSLDPNAYCGSAWSAIPGIAIPYIFHLGSDVMIYLLPFPVLRVLILPKRQKIGIGITFGLGFLCLFFASAVIASSYLSPYLSTEWMCSCFEQTWCIAVVCAPAFKLFLTKDLGVFVRKMRSRVSTMSAERSRSGTSKGGKTGNERSRGDRDREGESTELEDKSLWGDNTTFAAGAAGGIGGLVGGNKSQKSTRSGTVVSMTTIVEGPPSRGGSHEAQEEEIHSAV